MEYKLMFRGSTAQLAVQLPARLSLGPQRGHEKLNSVASSRLRLLQSKIGICYQLIDLTPMAWSRNDSTTGCHKDSVPARVERLAQALQGRVDLLTDQDRIPVAGEQHRKFVCA